jgi:hypothetical protein
MYPLPSLGLIWNCRGVSKKGIATKVKDLYSKYKADFIGLQETMRKNFCMALAALNRKI